MLTIYGWDEVSGEVSQIEADLPEDAKTQDVMDAWHNHIASDYDASDEVWFAAELVTLTVVVGKFGHHKQFMMWWGNENIAANYAEIIGTTGEES